MEQHKAVVITGHTVMVLSLFFQTHLYNIFKQTVGPEVIQTFSTNIILCKSIYEYWTLLHCSIRTSSFVYKHHACCLNVIFVVQLNSMIC